MDNLDFTISSSYVHDYDIVAVLDFFKSAGKVESVASGQVIFTEDKKGSKLLMQRDKMYLLLDGEVAFTVKDKFLGAVHKGEIFGELASITRMARSATATANTACKFIAVDDKQFQIELNKKPEFALTLMRVIVQRLRKSIGQLKEVDSFEELSSHDSVVFNKKMQEELEEGLGYDARMRFNKNKVIVAEGQAGVMMYVVLDGTVAVTIKGRVVDRLSAGGMFGEMALIDRTERLANVIAETDCTLLSINREAFLNLVKNNPKFGIIMLNVVGERAMMAARRT
jgi:CRP-like cAMP-binding protein